MHASMEIYINKNFSKLLEGLVCSWDHPEPFWIGFELIQKMLANIENLKTSENVQHLSIYTCKITKIHECNEKHGFRKH